MKRRFFAFISCVFMVSQASAISGDRYEFFGAPLGATEADVIRRWPAAKCEEKRNLIQGVENDRVCVTNVQSASTAQGFGLFLFRRNKLTTLAVKLQAGEAPKVAKEVSENFGAPRKAEDYTYWLAGDQLAFIGPGPLFVTTIDQAKIRELTGLSPATDSGNRTSRGLETNSFEQNRQERLQDQEGITQKRNIGVSIGMTTTQVLESIWGKPSRVSRSIRADDVTELWSYGTSRYLYFENGRLKSINISE